MRMKKSVGSGGCPVGRARESSFRQCCDSLRRSGTALLLAFALTPCCLASPGARSAAFGNLPLSFEANRGQTDARVQYLARGPGYVVLLTPGEAVIKLRTPTASAGPADHAPQSALRVGRRPGRDQAESVLRLRLVEANPRARVTARDPLPGVVSYFIGNVPGQWRTGIETHARVHYAEVYPGVDLVYYGNQQELEYDFVVAPGADPDRIRLEFVGASAVELEDSGDLRVTLGPDAVRWRRPIAWQERAGRERDPVPAAYHLEGGNRVGFRLGDYDRSRPLVIDPVLHYGTLLGGTNYDRAAGIAMDAAGNVYIAGATLSVNFPTVSAYRSTAVGSNDVFVTKLNSNGTALVYSTYLGGSGDEAGAAIAVDSAGQAYVVGNTDSLNFPTRNAGQTARAGSFDAFLTKLGPVGTNLLYSTYFGGSDFETGNGVAVDNTGIAYLVGGTFSGNQFPKKNNTGIQNNPGGFEDAYVAKFNTTLTGAASILYASWLGGNADDHALAVALDATGNVHITGEVVQWDETVAVTWPRRGTPFQSIFQGGVSDAFVTKINPGGTAVLYSGFLGGAGVDTAHTITVDAAGNVLVAGSTTSTNFPLTAGAAQSVRGDEALGAGFLLDGFVVKLNASGNALLYGTWLGGLFNETIRGVAVDGAGAIYLTGETDSFDFPVTPGADQEEDGGGVGVDAFVAKINPDVFGSSGLIYASYLGGDSLEEGCGVVVDANGRFVVAGVSYSTNFTTSLGAYQTVNRGAGDAFVVAFASPVDLSVSLQASTNATVFGSNVTYTLKVHNNGYRSFSGVFLTNPLPPTLQLVGLPTTTRGSVIQTNPIVVSFGVLTNFATATVTVPTRTTVPTVVTNEAYLVAIEPEPNFANNTASAVTVVQGVADLVLSMSAPAGPILAGSNYTYTIGITNKGPQTANAVVVTDLLPLQCDYVSAVATGGAVTFNFDVTWSVGALTNGEGQQLTITVRAINGPAATNVVVATTRDLDPLPENNTVTRTTLITPRADLGLSGSVTPNPVAATSNVVFALALTNHGQSTATGVVVTNRLPSELSYLSASPSQGSVSHAQGVVTWTVGTLTNAGRATLNVNARSFANGRFTNSAEAVSSIIELNPSDNVVTLTGTAIGLADLAMFQTAAPNPVTVASNLTAVFTLTNLGPTRADDVNFSAPLPPGFWFVSAESLQGLCSFMNGVVSCPLGSLSSGAVATVTIRWRAGDLGTVNTMGNLLATTSDPNPANNTVSSSVTVVANPAGPLLSIMWLTNNLVLLHWPTNVTGFSLQFRTNLLPESPWVTLPDVPVRLGPRFYVTNNAPYPVGGYRLFQTAAPGPLLEVFPSGADVVLSWPTSAVDFRLEATRELSESSAWIPVERSPATVGQWYYVTNPNPGGAEFFRLKRTTAGAADARLSLSQTGQPADKSAPGVPER